MTGDVGSEDAAGAAPPTYDELRREVEQLRAQVQRMEPTLARLEAAEEVVAAARLEVSERKRKGERVPLEIVRKLGVYDATLPGATDSWLGFVVYSRHDGRRLGTVTKVNGGALTIFDTYTGETTLAWRGDVVLSHFEGLWVMVGDVDY